MTCVWILEKIQKIWLVHIVCWCLFHFWIICVNEMGVYELHFSYPLSELKLLNFVFRSRYTQSVSYGDAVDGCWCHLLDFGDRFFRSLKSTARCIVDKAKFNSKSSFGLKTFRLLTPTTVLYDLIVFICCSIVFIKIQRSVSKMIVEGFFVFKWICT